MKDDFFGKSSSRYAKSIYRKLKISEYTGDFALGPHGAKHLISDPKHFGFLFARYKFVAKMFEGYKNVLEIGCQEGIGSMVVAKTAKKLVAIDFYRPHIESCLKRIGRNIAPNIKFIGHDIIDGPMGEKFDGIFAIDVIEHIDHKQEDRFMKNVLASLSKYGVLIFGTPSLESQRYASLKSRAGHINCKDGKEWRIFCGKYFRNVFMFGMNDEVIHTGFLPMAQYIMTICAYPKK